MAYKFEVENNYVANMQKIFYINEFLRGYFKNYIIIFI